MRLFLFFVAMAVLFAIPFLLWGESFDRLLSGEAAVEWLQGYGQWAWAAALGMLVLDIILPIPSTAVMAALGLLYGPWLGGLAGTLGSFLSGCVAYGFCRAFGQKAALRIAGARDLRRGEEIFSSVGGWAVALSRWLPLFPEVVACMAGLTRMPLAPFLVALLCGCLPMAFAFAAVGHVAVDRPGLCLALSAGLPLILWPLARLLLRASQRRN